MQRDFFDDALAEASQLTDAVSSTATDAVSSVTNAASSAADAASGVVDTAIEAVSSAASAVGNAATAGVDAVTDAASDAVTAITSTPLFATARAQASALAARFGGRVSLVGTKLIITLPRFPLMGVRNTPLLELPSANVRLPFLAAGGAVGPLVLEGDLSLAVAIRPEMIAAVGPADVRAVRIELDPLGGSASAQGTLHLAGSNSLITPIEAGLDSRVTAVIMVGEVPVPVQADALGGLRLALRGSGLGSLEETATLAYGGGRLALDSVTTLKLGARIDAELDATVELNLYGEPLCVYTWPLATWLLAQNAQQYQLQVTLGISGGKPSMSLGPITSRPIPVTDIEAHLPSLPRTRDCSPLDRLIDILCRKGIIPRKLCNIPGHGGGAQFGSGSGASGASVGVGAPIGPPSGRTQADPIPMIWYKSPGKYPPSIPLSGERYFLTEPDWLRVPPDPDLADVRRDAQVDRTGNYVIPIGVSPASKFYPAIGRVWPRVSAGVVRTGVKQDQFRRLLAAHGHTWGSDQADHVRDLQWRGEDDYRNLWPLSAAANNAANQILNQSVTYRNAAGVAVTQPIHATPLNLYFRIIAYA